MRVFLVRHGETDLNSQRRVQGHTDAPLNERGRNEARSLREPFDEREVVAVWCSPLVRARETAEIVFGHRQIPFHFDDRLKEMNYGELEGLTFAETSERYGAEVRAWRDHPESTAFPGGESLVQLQQRAWDCFTAIREAAGDEPVSVVTHNFTIVALVLGFLEAPLRSFKKFRMRPTGVTVIEDGYDGPALSLLNDVSHLRLLPELGLA